MPRERNQESAELGQRIKRIRLERGVDTATLSAQSGLSRPFINQVEAGTADPSMKSLRRLAETLGVPLAHLFADEGLAADEPREVGGLPRGSAVDATSAYGRLVEELALRASQLHEVQVVRSDRRKRLVWPDESDGQMLTPDLRRLLQVIISEHEPGETAREPHSHSGETLLYVLDGSLEAIVDGVSYRLETGDAISFPSTMPHQDRPAGKGRCRVLTVNVPPNF